MSRSRCSRWALPTPRMRFHEVDGKSRREPPIDVSPMAVIKLLYSTTEADNRENIISKSPALVHAERGERDPDRGAAGGERDFEPATLHDARREKRAEDGRFDHHAPDRPGIEEQSEESSHRRG